MLKTLLGFLLAVGPLMGLADAPVLPEPPPYGAYWWDRMGMTKAQYAEATEAIARRYGYPTAKAAADACQRKLGAERMMTCSLDPVAHRRNESVEIAKYGFKNWSQAVFACIKSMPVGFGPTSPVNPNGKLGHCQADPFLRLRHGIK